eukprot:Rmarinus@m.5189
MLAPLLWMMLTATQKTRSSRSRQLISSPMLRRLSTGLSRAGLNFMTRSTVVLRCPATHIRGRSSFLRVPAIVYLLFPLPYVLPFLHLNLHVFLAQRIAVVDSSGLIRSCALRVSLPPLELEGF